MSTTIVALPGTYRNERPYPFCPGCGHGTILDAINQALVDRGTDPERVVIVSDIGCAGLSDQYFGVSAFHGLHGRSITYATGIKLARPDLDVLVVMGDGGTGIGGAHLLSAARRNIGISVVVFNNFNFGMTGGQHSTTTPTGAVTPTTHAGNLERPMDICSTVAVNGAGYVYRGTTNDEALPLRIAEAMDHPGFSLLDVWELCTAYFVRNNKFSQRSIDATLKDLDFATGVLQVLDRPEFATAYRDQAAGERSKPDTIQPRFESSLDRRLTLVAAGAAGGKVRSAVRLVGSAAIMSGLWAAQRDDYPVTVKTGHSVSALTLDRDPIDYVGAATPDAVIVLAPEGMAKVANSLMAMTGDGLVLAAADIGQVDAGVEVARIDFGAAGTRMAAGDQAIAAVAGAVRRLDLMPVEALVEAARAYSRRPSHAIAAIEFGAAAVG